jgi:hypothetical protein
METRDPFPAFKKAKTSAVSWNYMRALNIARIKKTVDWIGYIDAYDKQVLSEKHLAAAASETNNHAEHFATMEKNLQLMIMYGKDIVKSSAFLALKEPDKDDEDAIIYLFHLKKHEIPS